MYACLYFHSLQSLSTNIEGVYPWKKLLGRPKSYFISQTIFLTVKEVLTRRNDKSSFLFKVVWGKGVMYFHRLGRFWNSSNKNWKSTPIERGTFLLHRFVEGTVNNINLLFTSELNKVHRISRNPNCKLWIFFWMFHRI